MARRELEEINAGSMADIAFLLLIFFLVTTTMEVDAGISRSLPFKREPPPGYVPPQVHNRDILVIMANSNDELLVENQPMELEELEEKVMLFYTANRNGQDNDKTMPMYEKISIDRCNQEIAGLKAVMATATPEMVTEIYEPEVDKWEKRKVTCERLGSGYNEISPQAIIQLKNQANTSYGLYIQVQNILKKVVNDLRVEECEERWGVDYFQLKPENPGDLEKLDMLQFLVPERIIEAKIEI